MSSASWNILTATVGRVMYSSSHEFGKEFSELINIVKAAEMLGFIETPKQRTILTPLGRRFANMDTERAEDRLEAADTNVERLQDAVCRRAGLKKRDHAR